MRSCWTLPLAALALAALPACPPAAEPPPAAGPAGLSPNDRSAIEGVSQLFAVGANAGDWAAVGATYTPDAVLLPPNGPVVQGRAAIQAFLATFPPISDMQLTTVEVEGAGDLAFVRGTYTMTLMPPGAPAIADTGKYLEIRKRQADGTWLISHDMFSSDLAP